MPDESHLQVFVNVLIRHSQLNTAANSHLEKTFSNFVYSLKKSDGNIQRAVELILQHIQ